jgi:hypothetical protein
VKFVRKSEKSKQPKDLFRADAVVRSVRFLNKGSHVAVYEPEHVYDQALADERNAIYSRTAGGDT